MKMLLNGQYTYLTYMLLSATCFFFWLTPNFHKIKSLFSFTQNEEYVRKRNLALRYPEIYERR